MTPEMLHLFESMKGVNPFSFAFIALLAGAFGKFVKGKTFGDFLDWLPVSWVSRIPKAHIKWYAIGFALVTSLVYARFSLGLGWPESFTFTALGAMLGGGTAIGGHETVGKALERKPDAPPTTGGNGGDDVGVDQPPPKGPSVLRVGFVAAAMLAMLSAAPAAPSQPGLAPLTMLTGCGLLNPKTIVEAALTVSDLACLETGEGSKTDSPEEAATACKLAQDPLLRQIVRELVGQRVAAKRAGFVWRPVSAEAGAPTDGGVVEFVSAKDGGR